MALSGTRESIQGRVKKLKSKYLCDGFENGSYVHDGYYCGYLI